MSNRSERRERRQNKVETPQLKSRQDYQKSLWQKIRNLSLFWKIVISAFAFVSSVLTVVGAYYAFSFKLTLDPSDSLDPTKAFATQFVLRNESLLPINSIELKLIVGKITLENDADLNAARIIKDIPPIPILTSGEKKTLLLPYPPFLSPPVKFADITAEISYTTSLLSLKKKALKRFATAKASDGTVHWQHKALSE